LEWTIEAAMALAQGKDGYNGVHGYENSST